MPRRSANGQFGDVRGGLFTFSPAANLCALNLAIFSCPRSTRARSGEGVAVILGHEIAEESSGAGLEDGSGIIHVDFPGFPAAHPVQTLNKQTPELDTPTRL